MVDERFYELDDGTELVLMESVTLNDIRYLLLSDNGSDNVYIAYENDGKLIFVDESYSLYSEIVMSLFKKFKDNFN